MIFQIRAYLLSMAFSLAFGAMFAKTYRVYRIFTRSCIGVVKNKVIKQLEIQVLNALLKHVYPHNKTINQASPRSAERILREPHKQGINERALDTCRVEP